MNINKTLIVISRVFVFAYSLLFTLTTLRFIAGIVKDNVMFAIIFFLVLPIGFVIFGIPVAGNWMAVEGATEWAENNSHTKWELHARFIFCIIGILIGCFLFEWLSEIVLTIVMS